MYPDPGLPDLPLDDPVHRRQAGADRAQHGNEFSLHRRPGAVADHAKTSLIILNSPDNPCGGATPQEEVAKLAAGLARHPNVAVMSDEIYSQMLYGGRQHESFLRYPEIRDRLIVSTAGPRPTP
jgi:aspartate/methionine/tyrosine aminotransferase